jgi:nucleotidyltransferase substrate binding protein (TIGR01987 family)
MEQENWERKKRTFKNALDRLEESLQIPTDQNIVIDGVIQRFEFTFELSWKWLKQYLEYKGILDAKAPRDVFRHAYALDIIQDGEAFIEMMKDRKISSHTYDEATANAIYKRIKDQHYFLLLALYNRFKGEVVEP